MIIIQNVWRNAFYCVPPGDSTVPRLFINTPKCSPFLVMSLRQLATLQYFLCRGWGRAGGGAAGRALAAAAAGGFFGGMDAVFFYYFLPFACRGGGSFLKRAALPPTAGGPGGNGARSPPWQIQRGVMLSLGLRERSTKAASEGEGSTERARFEVVGSPVLPYSRNNAPMVWCPGGNGR